MDIKHIGPHQHILNGVGDVVDVLNQLHDVLSLQGGDESPGELLHHVVLGDIRRMFHHMQFLHLFRQGIRVKFFQRILQHGGGFAGEFHRLHEHVEIIKILFLSHD